MQRRYDTSQIPLHNHQICTILQDELRGQSALYGRRLTYTRLKQLGVPVARNRMYEQVHELDPGGVTSRQFARQNIPHGEYQVAGPNRVMSVDGHHKLTMYGVRYIDRPTRPTEACLDRCGQMPVRKVSGGASGKWPLATSRPGNI